ncbi:MAG: hotdog fold thioesterase [Cytophagales bacterium]|nr:hotdog fold thioesterase [Cytophagales bacterium]
MFPEDLSIEALNDIGKNTMFDAIGIRILEVGKDYIKGSMPVNERTKQPMGLLHGGASVAFAETLGSIASTLVIDISKKAPVGLEINANHIKSAREGLVYGICRPLHVGSRTHVWEIKITNEQDQLVCVSRLTCSIIDQRH